MSAALHGEIPISEDPMTAATTVFGVPLEPGERVVYFRRVDPNWNKPALIVAGVLTLIFFIGIFFLAAGLMDRTTCWIITTRRFMIISKKVAQMRYEQIAEMEISTTSHGNSWCYLRAKGNAMSLGYQMSVVPEIVPLLQRYLADRNALEQAPTVAYDASALLKSATAPMH